MSDIDSNLYFSQEPMGSEANVLLAKKKVEFYSGLDQNTFPGAKEVIEAYQSISTLNVASKGGFVSAALDAEQAFLESNNIPNHQEFLDKAKKEVVQQINNKTLQAQRAQQAYASSPQGMATNQAIETQSLQVANQVKEVFQQQMGLQGNQIEALRQNYNPTTGGSGPVTSIRVKFDSLEEASKFDVQYLSPAGILAKSNINRSDQYFFDLPLKSCQQNLQTFSELAQKAQSKQEVNVDSAPKTSPKSSKSGIPILREFEQLKKGAHTTFKDIRDTVKDAVKSRFKNR